MNEGQQPKRDRNFLERLDRAFDEAYSEDESSLREFLSEAGVDPDAIARDGLAAVERFRRQHDLADLRARLERVRGDVMHVLRSVRVDPGQIRHQIANALAGSDARLAQVYYHKLEAVDLDDLASLPEDEAILTLFARVVDEDAPSGN